MTTDDSKPRPFEDLRDSGLLWLINAAVFHPRGWAFAVTFDGDGKALGWHLEGGGTEVWQFPEDSVDRNFEAAQRTLRPAGRSGNSSTES